jgi:signal peptidase I
MLKILKISGDSMSPDFLDGDFVIIVTAKFLKNRLKVGDNIIFHHKFYGTLIKRISSLDPGTAEYYVEGTRTDSLDSRRLGTIRGENITGKVIAHFPRIG